MCKLRGFHCYIGNLYPMRKITMPSNNHLPVLNCRYDSDLCTCFIENKLESLIKCTNSFYLYFL